MLRLVEESGVLDPNSAYCYLLLATRFRDTCVVAADEGGELLGFVTGFVPPARPDTLFVWQIGVAAGARGRGLGRRMIEEVLARDPCRGVRFVEATVTPSNTASQRLFEGLARRAGSVCRVERGFEPAEFPDPGHEPEQLFRIGPLARPTPDERVPGESVAEADMAVTTA